MRRAGAVVRALALGVLAVIAAVTLGRGIQRGTTVVQRRIRPPERAAAAASLSYFACLERIVEAGMPHGVKVFVVAKSDADYQRLTELLTPHVVTVRSRADADHVVSFAPSPAGCSGTSVAVGPP
jgi:hypothetical protein